MKDFVNKSYLLLLKDGPKSIQPSDLNLSLGVTLKLKKLKDFK